MSTAAAVAALKKASDGLTYQSESDAPFEVFTWKGAAGELTKDEVLKRVKKSAKSAVQELAPDDFFKDLTADQDWYGAEEKATAKRYRDLQAAVRSNLSGARVFKVGKTRVDVCVVGKTDEGDWAGLKTTAVET